MCNRFEDAIDYRKLDYFSLYLTVKVDCRESKPLRKHRKIEDKHKVGR